MEAIAQAPTAIELILQGCSEEFGHTYQLGGVTRGPRDGVFLRMFCACGAEVVTKWGPFMLFALSGPASCRPQEGRDGQAETDPHGEVPRPDGVV